MDVNNQTKMVTIFNLILFEYSFIHLFIVLGGNYSPPGSAGAARASSPYGVHTKKKR